MVIIMNNLECNYLIELIRNVLNNEKTEYREDVDYKKLFNIAKMHTLVIYLYYGLKYYDIPVLSDLLKKAYSENIYKTAVQEAEKEIIHRKNELKETEKRINQRQDLLDKRFNIPYLVLPKINKNNAITSATAPVVHVLWSEKAIINTYVNTKRQSTTIFSIIFLLNR